ncbi:MAG TPA: ferrous iron transport protein A [Anaerolineae bacterium]|nr:ferrous iron transport protein A [Anaerolineae bacterium]HID83976.1 ferrous iron transport protein A [Anaerolineales bacterium]HIQ08992.1 ferrous iron transport protein A [Anaerolineaceae bacterium]
MSLRTRTATQDVSLDQLATGEQARVRDVQGGRTLRTRLATFGFVPGAEVHVWHNMGVGPIIVQVHGTRVALGRGEAARIFVEVINGRRSHEDGEPERAA